LPLDSAQVIGKVSPVATATGLKLAIPRADAIANSDCFPDIQV
jgi:hypothetical protein